MTESTQKEPETALFCLLIFECFYFAQKPLNFVFNVVNERGLIYGWRRG